MQHRLAGCHHHDRDDEQRLGEIAPINVVSTGLHAAGDEQKNQQRAGPQAEHRLNLTKQMKQPFMLGEAMPERRNLWRQEGVQDRQHKQHGGNGLGGGWIHRHPGRSTKHEIGAR